MAEEVIGIAGLKQLKPHPIGQRVNHLVVIKPRDLDQNQPRALIPLTSISWAVSSDALEHQFV